MIITLIKKDTGIEVIQRLKNKYKSKTELENKYLESNNHLYYLDLEDWKYFEKHPDEIQCNGKTIITDNLDLNDTDLEILSLLKKEDRSIESISDELNKDCEEIRRNIYKLVKEGIIKKELNNLIKVCPYDEIRIEI